MPETVASEMFFLSKTFQSNKEVRIANIELFEQKLLHRMHTFNQAHLDNTVVVASPAIELFKSFALQECIKNSIDAEAFKVTVSIYLDNGEVIVLVTDDGLHKLNHQALPYDEYPYLDALSRASLKKSDNKNTLGRAGKGLAMSTQYLKLFAKRGALLAGARANKNAGFVVVLASENEPARHKWNAYFSEFEQFSSNIFSFWQAGPVSRDGSLRDEEKALLDRVADRSCQTNSDVFTLFDLASNEVASAQPTGSLAFNFKSPVTPGPVR